MPVDLEAQERRQALQEAVAAEDAGLTVRCARELLNLGRGNDVAFCATAFKKIAPALVKQGHRPLKTFAVRSVTVEPILPALQVEAALGGYVLDVEVGGFGSYMDDMLNPQGSLSLPGPIWCWFFWKRKMLRGGCLAFVRRAEETRLQRRLRLL